MSDTSPPAAAEPAGAADGTIGNKKGRFALVLDEKEAHGYWSSRAEFFLATMGAAIGFGNVWRFPALMFAYGGGAFLIPYLMALFLLGIPLTILEIGFGQYFQTGDIGVFGTFHPRLRGVGLCSVACGFMLDTYYVVLIAWVLNAFFSTWNSDSPWGNPDLTGEEAVTYFMTDIIGGGTVAEEGTPTRIVWRNVGFAAAAWFICFMCVAWGVGWTGKIAYFTMGLPIVLLFLFLGVACSLEGASEGIHSYIGIWDMSVLTEQGEVWSVACSQIFFSIGLTFGIMTAYGSHCKRTDPAVFNSSFIACSDSMFAFIAGFAVFAALGNMAYTSGVDDISDLPYSGFGLVFGTWPVVFSSLPGGIHWVRLIFFNLFLLGIDSAFSFLEAFIAVLHDTVYFEKVPRFWLAMGLSILGWCCSILYCTDAGLSFLDVVDFYINFVMILVGFFEAFGAGWCYDILGQFESLGRPVVLSFMVGNFGAVLVACGLWFGLKENAVLGGFLGLILVYLVGVAVTWHFLKQLLASDTDNRWTSMKSLWWEVYFGNVVALRDRIQEYVGAVPFLWCLLIKHFIPHLLIVLFINLAQSKNVDGDPVMGNYGGYPTWPYQVLGILSFAFTLFIFLVGLVFPKLYAPLALPQTKEAQMILAPYEGSDSGVPKKQIVDATEDKSSEGEGSKTPDADVPAVEDTTA